MVTTTTGLATSFITFTRTSNATVTDSNGFIEWAGHNLLTNSESFDASAWSRSGISAVTANSTAAPNGTTTADTVVEDTSASANHFVAQTPTIAAAQAITYGVWVKRGSGTRNIAITIIASGGSDYISQVYDLGAGTLGSSTAVGTGVITDKTISSAGSGWYYITLTGTPSTTAAVTGGACRLALANGTTFGSQTYTGDGTSSVILWGAHLSFASLGGMVLNPARGDAYYPTTPRNLLGYTENFNVGWTKNRVTAPTASVTNPAGLDGANLITDNNVSGTHNIQAGVNVPNSASVTLSAYFKKGTATYAGIWLNDNFAVNSRVIVNLDTGIISAGGGVSTANGRQYITSSSTPIGNGWYRLSITAITANNDTTVYPTISFSLTGSETSPPSYVGTGSTFYLWGAQLSDSASLDAYSPVYGAAVTSAAYYAPRLDYDPVTLAARGLLVEEQRVNLLTYSAQFDDAAWVKTEATISANAAVAPDGLSTADKIIESTTASVQHFVRQGVTTTVQAYTFSAYVKAAGRTWCSLYTDGAAVGKYFDLTNGVVGNNSGGAPTSATITAVGSGWYRVAITFTSTAASVSNYIFTASANGTQAYTGDGTSGILVWGAQLEAGSFATSYIPTGAATATRTADVASVSTQAFPYSASEGTIVVNADTYSFVAIRRNVQLDDGTASERMYIGTSTAAAPYAVVVDGNSTQADLTASGTLSTNTPYKLALAYNVNDFAACGNGGTVATDTSGTVPTVNTMRLGSTHDSLFINGHIRQVTYIPRRLSNSELQARTA